MRRRRASRSPFRTSLAVSRLTLTLVLLAPPLFAEPSATPRDSPFADRFDHIETLLGQADFDGAEREATDLLRSGTLSRERLARVYELLGIVASARGDHAGAERALRRALRLDPALVLPKTAGPHVVDSLKNARASLAAQVELNVAVDLRMSSAVAELDVRADVVGEPEGLAARVVVEAPDFRRELALAEGQRTLRERIQFSPGACRTFVASVTDEFGNVVWPNAARAETCRATEVVRPVKSTPQERRTPRAAHADPAQSAGTIPAQVWIAGGITAALAVATGVLGFHALDARSEYHAALDDPNADEEAVWHLRERAQSAQHRATVTGVMAGVSGVTTLLLYVFRPTGSSRAAPSAMATPTIRF
jgi:hypothetical protein